MFAAAEPSQSHAIDPHHGSRFLPNLAIPTPASPARPVTRRPSFEQGRALEVLGHAIEYLVDSRMYPVHAPTTRADSEATQLLMLQSRQIFTECAEVVPAIRRLRLWIAERLSTPADC
jgi:hypothetical protein